MHNISIADFTGGPFAVSAEDGHRIHERLFPLLAANEPAALSFAGIEILTGAFLASAIGPFCANYSEAELARLLTVRDISLGDREMVKLSLMNARRYYANPAAFDTAWAAEMGKDDAVTIGER